jgi:hypothetical protein
VSVSSGQRFTKAQPCPVCGGHKDLPQGEGRRCWGFVSDDAKWAHCVRSEYAGGLTLKPEADTYAHKLQGSCLCGKSHGEAAAPPVSANGHKREIVATYDYVDESGHLLFQTLRYVPKDFKQRRPDSQGGWVWDLKGVRRVLYRLPELLASTKEPVFIVEGRRTLTGLLIWG